MFGLVSLVVPADARYRVLAPDLAGKVVELAGGTAADATTLAQALVAAMDELCPATDAGAHIDLAFRPELTGLSVEIRCHGRSTVVRHLLSAEKR